MFKRKCHEYGQAIVRAGDLLIMCECISELDIKTVLDRGTEIV